MYQCVSEHPPVQPCQQCLPHDVELLVHPGDEVAGERAVHFRGGAVQICGVCGQDVHLVVLRQPQDHGVTSRGVVVVHMTVDGGDVDVESVILDLLVASQGLVVGEAGGKRHLIDLILAQTKNKKRRENCDSQLEHDAERTGDNCVSVRDKQTLLNTD